MASADLTALALASSLAYVVRFGTSGQSRPHLLTLAPVLIGWVGLLGVYGLYDLARLSPTDEFRRVFGAVSAGVLLIAIGSYWSKFSLSRSWLGFTWGFAICFELATRRIWRWHFRRLKRKGRLRSATLIVGTNVEATTIAKSIGEVGTGFVPSGYVSISSAACTSDLGGLPVFGSLSVLAKTIRERGVERLFVAASAVSPDEMRRIVRVAHEADVDLWSSANPPEIAATKLVPQMIGPIAAVSIDHGIRRTHAVLKRCCDVVVSAVGLLFTGPLILLVAAAIRLDSRGPAFYHQERVGRGGKSFRIFKFRTMVAGAEEMLGDLLHLNEASGPLFKMRHDPRTTSLGRWLRRWSIDEIPQLVNVFKGEMSLVGPRPALQSEVDPYKDWHWDRLEVAPGMTGVWQVNGRSHLSFDEYVRGDLFYIENWSLSLDLYVLIKTIPAVLRRRGAF